MKYLVTILLVVFVHSIYASIPNLVFTNLSVESGLTNNHVQSIYKDHLGYMWFGTNDGLNMYDGYDFTQFTGNSLNNNSLSGNAVFKIFEDSKQRLWVATDNGINLFVREKMHFRHVRIYSENENVTADSYVRDVMEDKAGNILIATSPGILIYDSLKQYFVRYLTDISEYNAISKSGIRTFIIDKHNRIWIGSVTFGLFAYDLTKKTVISSPLSKGLIDAKRKVFKLTESATGDIWIGTDQGVFIVKEDLSGIEQIPMDMKKNILNSNNVLDIKTDRKQRMWIGTDGGGVMMIDGNDITSRRYLIGGNTHNLNDDAVHSIYVDDQDILWLGTYKGGVNYCHLESRKQFFTYRSTNRSYSTNSLNTILIGAILKDKEDNLWMGTDGAGIEFVNAKTGIKKYYIYDVKNPNTIGGNSILTLCEDHQGRIWAGGYLSGVSCIDRSTGQIQRFKHDPDNENSLSNNDVRDIYVDNNGNIWIATNGGGLDNLDPVNRRFTHYKSSGKNSLVSDWCLKIFADSRGRLWIGTYGGLSIYDVKNNTFKNYVQGNDSGSICNNWVYSINEDSRGNIWIGTSSGLNRYDRKKDAFETINISDKLFNNVINGILVDDQNNIWLSTNLGIACYNTANQKFKNYDVSDGLQGHQFVHGAYYKDDAGIMYFGGLNGFNSFHPDSILDNPYIPPVYITNLLIYFEQAEIGKEGSPLKKSIAITDKIYLTYEQSVITFRYASLNYIHPAKNKYAYKLIGFDNHWNYVGSRREATYTNLDPGTYVFQVIGSNNDGVWNNKGASLTIVILPPWWRTLVFRILLVIIILAAAVTFYITRFSRLKRQRILLEKTVKERTQEVEEKNAQLSVQTIELSQKNELLEERQQMILEQSEEMELTNQYLRKLVSTKDRFFSIIAHDLKNPFNTILGFAELLVLNFKNLSNEKREKYANLIFESALSVYNLLENLLQWSRTQINRVSFEPKNIDMLELFRRNIELLKEMLRNKKVVLELVPAELAMVFADSNMMDVIVRNLLTNAIKFSHQEGKIQIDFKTKSNFLEVSITDSGIGMSPEEIDTLFRIDSSFTKEGTQGEKGTGLGLILCKEYIERNKGTIRVESETGKGSVFYFTVPLEDSN